MVLIGFIVACWMIHVQQTVEEVEMKKMHATPSRLQGRILNKARRGALKLVLPIGLCYTESDAIVLDPDLQVQGTIQEVFRSFAHTGSAFATVRHFRKLPLLFPRRIRRGPHTGELAWAEIEHHDVLRILHHSTYAGAFVYGRTRDRPLRSLYSFAGSGPAYSRSTCSLMALPLKRF